VACDLQRSNEERCGKTCRTLARPKGRRPAGAVVGAGDCPDKPKHALAPCWGARVQ
jgi:hypothetical protein